MPEYEYLVELYDKFGAISTNYNPTFFVKLVYGRDMNTIFEMVLLHRRSLASTQLPTWSCPSRKWLLSLRPSAGNISKSSSGQYPTPTDM